ncbi:MAG TPA: hypothetical protein VFH35_13310 [Ramlibacter sp.]|nr:hypothetical protein [Ramlibacter sp.]
MSAAARLACLLLVGLGAALPAQSQQLHKCRDASGRVTYSDKLCEAPPPPRPAAPAGPPPNQAAEGKLTVQAVEGVLRHAAQLGMRSDYQAQCALAAPNLSFEITDHSTTPVQKFAGGRSELCGLQRESARVILANDLVPSIKLGKIDVRMNAEKTQATATSESVTTLARQGQAVMVTRCVREEVLGVVGKEILYLRVVATCRPAG